MRHVYSIVTNTLVAMKKSRDCLTFGSEVVLHWLWEVELVIDACGLGVTKVWRWLLGF